VLHEWSISINLDNRSYPSSTGLHQLTFPLHHSQLSRSNKYLISSTSLASYWVVYYFFLFTTGEILPPKWSAVVPRLSYTALLHYLHISTLAVIGQLIHFASYLAKMMTDAYHHWILWSWNSFTQTHLKHFLCVIFLMSVFNK